MKYYHEKTLKNVSFEEAIEKVTEALKEEGFGILTEIDVQATLKKKLDEDIRPYRILGACNPSYAHKAILAEDKIGVMLPIYFSQILIIGMLLLGAWKYDKLKHPATYLALGVNLFIFLMEPIGKSETVQLFLKTIIKG